MIIKEQMVKSGTVFQKVPLWSHFGSIFFQCTLSLGNIFCQSVVSHTYTLWTTEAKDDTDPWASQ